MAILHGPSGRPMVIAADDGVIYLGLCNVPVWQSQSWSLDCRKMSHEQAMVQRDCMITAASWQTGYLITPTPGSVSRWAWFHGYGPDAIIDPTLHGFSLGSGKDALTVPGTWFVFGSAPWWFVVPMLLASPTLRTTTHFRRWRRKRRGLCVCCGYDLRASPGNETGTDLVFVFRPQE
jgi:hypothetical protein